MQGYTARWGIDATPEASYGTAAALPDKSHPVSAVRPKVEPIVVDDAEMLLGVREEGSDSVVTGYRMSYAPEFDAHTDLVALYLKYALGALSTGAPVATVYPHTITVSQTDIPSFTGYYKGPDGQFQYPGCKIKKATLKGAKGGNIKLSLEIMGDGNENTSVVAMPAITKELLIPFSALTVFTWGGTDFKKRLQGFEITIENVIDESNEAVAGQLTLAEAEAGPVRITGKFDFLHKDRTVLDDVKAQNFKAVVLTIAPDANREITVNLYRVVLAGSDVGGGKTKLTHSPSFKAAYSTSDSKAIQVLVKNTTTAYT